MKKKYCPQCRNLMILLEDGIYWCSECDYEVKGETNIISGE